MVRRNYLIWALMAGLLLLVGAIFGRMAIERASAVVPSDALTDDGFRNWFWGHRTLDLITQVGLIFAGALGVAAVLPGQGEAVEATAPNADGGAGTSTERRGP